ncbi:bifunctional 4'-phosphopantothenoylcysteine decarboxylase/phosphopantothenoylcysteine synthetase, partial [candidate division KSB1 bacterium]
VNNPLIENSGFGSDSNKVWIINSKKEVEDLPLMKKDEISDIILKKVESLIQS